MQLGSAPVPLGGYSEMSESNATAVAICSPSAIIFLKDFLVEKMLDEVTVRRVIKGLATTSATQHAST